MNHSMPSHSQAPGQNQMPQNASQQRQAPSSPQNPAQRQLPQGQYTNYNPQLAYFILERPKNNESWDDVEPEIQHIPLQDLQSQLTELRRKKSNVTSSLGEISSATVRRRINELVEDENQKLKNLNKALHWKVANINIEWRQVGRHARQIRRVSVLLETEASGFPEPQNVRPPAAHPQGVPDATNPRPAGMGPTNNQAPNMAQKQKNSQQREFNTANSQRFEQPPPPPPPPGGMQGGMHAKSAGHHPHLHPYPQPPLPGHGHNAGVAPPPPPPPPPCVGVHLSHVAHPQYNSTPDIFPGPDQVRDMKHGKPSIGMMHEYLTRQKERPKHPGIRDSILLPSDDSDSETRTVGRREKKRHHEKHSGLKKEPNARQRSRSRDRHRRRSNDSHHHTTRRNRSSDEETLYSEINNSDYSAPSSRGSRRRQHRKRRSGRPHSGERSERPSPENGRYSKPTTRPHRRPHDGKKHGSPSSSDMSSIHPSPIHSDDDSDWDMPRRAHGQSRSQPYAQQPQHQNYPHVYDEFEDPTFPTRLNPRRAQPSVHIPSANPLDSPRYQGVPSYPTDNTARFQPGLHRPVNYGSYAAHPHYTERVAEQDTIKMTDLEEALNFLRTKNRTVLPQRR